MKHGEAKKSDAQMVSVDDEVLFTGVIKQSDNLQELLTCTPDKNGPWNFLTRSLPCRVEFQTSIVL